MDEPPVEGETSDRGDESSAERLDCGGSRYDADRTEGTVLFTCDDTIELPYGWTIAEAIANPLSTDWHEPVVRWMLSERIADADDHRSYLTRQAIIVWQIYKTGPWSLRCRKGAAYSALLVGVWSHDFVPRRGELANSVLNPEHDFFEQLEEDGGVEALMDLLHRSFVHRSVLDGPT